MCLKMVVYICCCVLVGIGKILIRKVTLERMSVFESVTFPLREICLQESCCNCFSKCDWYNSHLYVLAFCRSLVKYMPSILTKFFELLICRFLIFNQDCRFLHLLEGVTIIFEISMVARVAISYCLNMFNILTTDSSVLTEKFVSSEYWESFRSSFG